MKTLKLWVDDVRRPPSDDWVWARSVKDAIACINFYEHQYWMETILIDLDHDAGAFANVGGDYIKLLDWLETQNIVDTGYFFHIHSMNPVGVQNMRAIIQHNGWREISSIASFAN